MARMLAGSGDLEKAKRVLDERGVFVGVLERFDGFLILLRHHLGL
jgi:hypothetical protein